MQSLNANGSLENLKAKPGILRNSPLGEYQLYVADLGAYNEGRLVGEWITINGLSADEILGAIGAVLAKSGGEEWAIHDYEIPFDISEHPNFEQLVEQLACIDRHGEAYLAYLDSVGLEFASESNFEDTYSGEYDSPEAWAAEYMHDCMEIPENLVNYIDYSAFARDASYDRTSFRDYNGKTYVFHT